MTVDVAKVYIDSAYEKGYRNLYLVDENGNDVDLSAMKLVDDKGNIVDGMSII